MRKNLLVINYLIISFVLFSVGCNKDNVNASFTSSINEAEVGDTIVFTNESVNASYYQWDFGDGEQSYDKNPSHVYSNGGTYVVSLEAIGDKASDNATDTISVVYKNVSIYEGTGIDGVDIYDTWDDIQSIYTSDTITYLDDYTDTYGFYFLQVYFYNEGVAFGFYSNSSSLSATDVVYAIFLVSPYSGSTSKGISIGDDMDIIEDRYGEPESTYNGSYGTYGYYYDSQGVDFYSYASGVVDEIDIYESYVSYSSEKPVSLKKQIIRNGLLKNEKFPF